MSGARRPASDAAEQAGISGRVRAEQISQVISYSPGMMVANVCDAAVVVATFWNSPTRLLACSWAVCISAFACLHLAKRLWRPARKRPEMASSRSIRRAVRNACLLGLVWGSLPLLLFTGATPLQQIVIASLCSGMLGAAAIALASIPAAAILFIVPILAGSALNIGLQGGTQYLPIIGLGVVYGAVLIRIVFMHARQLRDRVIAEGVAQTATRTDALTGLPNRVGFQASCATALAHLERTSEGFALLSVDLDGLKAVNDKLGHSAGDELLSQAADRLRTCARSGDSIARLGGDEFALIFASVSDRHTATVIAQGIVEAFEAPFEIDGQEVVSTASVGVALAPFHGESPRDLLKSADTAMYRAKRLRGSFEIFEPRDGAEEQERRELERDLRRALGNGELCLHFQPLYELAAERIVGCEALLRWEHPVRGAIPPSVFVPLAEKTGFIRDIGEWVIQEACRTAMRWPPHMRVSVNLSPVQCRERRILSIVTDALATSRLPPHRLEIEITESEVISENEIATEMLHHLASLGPQIALDHFGAGYSSLNYLRWLPLNRIKIDKCFVADLDEPHSRTVVKAVLALAAELEIATTAEGVETNEQLAWLRSHGCGEVQGSLISRPVAAPSLAGMFAGTSAKSA